MSYIVTRYGTEVDLSYEHKTGCPWCISQGLDKSQNNLHVYGIDENGKHRGAHCFAGAASNPKHTIPSEEYMESSGFSYEYEEEFEKLSAKEFNQEIHNRLKEASGTDPRKYRGIPKEVSQPTGVRYQYDEQTGEVNTTYYPCTTNYELTGYKVRSHPKKFWSMGNTGASCDMFMQFRFKTHSGMCLIAGGEHDALAAYTMLKTQQKDKKFDEIAVVSPTIGETSAYSQVKNHYEWFNQMKRIVICMDSDEAGQKATEALVEVLPKGKVYVMKMRRKDPNSYLYDKESGKTFDFTNEFVSDFWAAKPYAPEGVKSASESFDEIEEELLKPRITLPPFMHKMQEMCGGGFIQGRIANIIADTSVGKSTFVNRMVYHWIFHSPEVPTIVSLEATAGQYMLEMLTIHLQKNLRWVMTDVEIIEYLKSEEGQHLKEELCFKEDGSPRFYLIDDRTGDIKDTEKQVEKLFKQYGSKMFVFDVLTNLLEGSSEQHIDDHMHFQRNMVKHGITFVNVLHTRKPPNSADGKPRKVTEYDAKNSGTFVQSAAYNIVMNRDKLAEDDTVKNTTEVDLPKCRGGKTGSAGKWYFDFITATCHDFDDYLQENPELARPKVDF